MEKRYLNIFHLPLYDMQSSPPPFSFPARTRLLVNTLIMRVYPDCSKNMHLLKNWIQIIKHDYIIGCPWTSQMQQCCNDARFYNSSLVVATLTKILQHNRVIGILVNWCISTGILTRITVEVYLFTRIPQTRLNVSLMVKNFSRVHTSDPSFCFSTGFLAIFSKQYYCLAQ